MMRIKGWGFFVFAFVLVSVILPAAAAEDPGEAHERLLLDDVVVTATRGQRSVRDLGGAASVVKAEDYADTGGGIESLLANEELLYVHGGTYPGSESSIAMRGIQGRYLTQRVLVMIDGRPINDEYQGAADIRTISLEGVDRVEVVRGPASALYGSDAIAGVINVIRKFGVPQTVFRAGFGEDQTVSQSLTHGDTKQGFRYQVTGSRLATDGHVTNMDGSDRDWDMGDFNTRFGWNIAGFSEISLALGFQQHSGTQDMFQDTQRLDYQDLRWVTDNGWEVRLFRNRLRRDLEWVFGFDAEYKQHTETGRVLKTHRLGAHLLTAGVEFEQETVDIEEASGDVDEDMGTFSLFVQDEMKLRDNVMLTLGARFDDNEDFDSQVSPRAGVVYRPLDSTDLYLSIAQAFRAPSMSDMYLPLAFFNGMFFEGSPDIDPETVWTYEIGARHVFSDKLAGRIAIYHNNLQDAWDYMVAPAPPYVTAIDPAAIYLVPRNVTEISVWGTELGLTWKPLTGLTTSFQFYFAEPLYEKYDPDPSIEDNVVEETPRIAASTGLTYDTPNGARLSTVLRHVGSRYTDAQNTSATKLDAYTVMDVHLVSPARKGLSLFLTISNLLNEGYHHFETYKEPGRKFFWGAVVRF